MLNGQSQLLICPTASTDCDQCIDAADERNAPSLAGFAAGALLGPSPKKSRSARCVVPDNCHNAFKHDAGIDCLSRSVNDQPICGKIAFRCTFALFRTAADDLR
jgi:hypothetical protein